MLLLYIGYLFRFIGWKIKRQLWMYIKFVSFQRRIEKFINKDQFWDQIEMELNLNFGSNETILFVVIIWIFNQIYLLKILTKEWKWRNTHHYKRI